MTPTSQHGFWCWVGRRRCNGGAEGIRTPDLINAIDALSQLSYSPTVLGMAARLVTLEVQFLPDLGGPMLSQRRVVSNSNL